MKIYQYDLEGNLVQEYKNKTEIGKHLLHIGKAYCVNTVIEHINQCLRNKKKTAYGYIWKSEDQLYKYIQIDNNDCIISEYDNIQSISKSTNVPINIIVSCLDGNIKHICGYKFKRVKKDIDVSNIIIDPLSEYKCSSGEYEIISILNYLNINYTFQKTFSWLKYKKNMYLDFYLDDYNLAIEYQGEQHFYPGFGISKSVFEDTTIKRDNLKLQLCLSHRINMEYINYDDIEDKLLRILRKSGALYRNNLITYNEEYNRYQLW